MRPIGGFFELELNRKTEYHPKALKLNTGRNALEYILRLKQYKKIYIPYYICNSVLEPIQKLEIEYDFYKINQDFQAEFDFKKLEESEVFLYVNYFGINDSNVQYYADLSKTYGFNLCVDNTQSFFSKPHEEIDTFYSPRKFLGVPDGAYLYTDSQHTLTEGLEQYYGYDKANHLLKRIDLGPDESYKDYRLASEVHKNQDIMKMSLLTESILSSIDYTLIKNTRLINFKYIHRHLKQFNMLPIDINNIDAPMVYPLYIKQQGIREYLISKNIFIATYWEEVLKNIDENQIEYSLVKNLIPVPIDQRYGLDQMGYILNEIIEYIER